MRCPLFFLPHLIEPLSLTFRNPPLCVRRLALCCRSPGHVSGGFLEEFGSSLQLLRTVFRSAADSQPFIIAGSGTLGWEIVAANLLEARPDGQGADVLVANTGYFSDSWADCFESFSLRVAQVAAPVLGETVSAEALVAALQANPSVRLVALTQVDTSTGVLNDIAALAQAVKAERPDVFVAVSGQCTQQQQQRDRVMREEERRKLTETVADVPPLYLLPG